MGVRGKKTRRLSREKIVFDALSELVWEKARSLHLKKKVNDGVVDRVIFTVWNNFQHDPILKYVPTKDSEVLREAVKRLSGHLITRSVFESAIRRYSDHEAECQREARMQVRDNQVVKQRGKSRGSIPGGNIACRAVDLPTT